jgi:hypothetical protein
MYKFVLRTLDFRETCDYYFHPDIRYLVRFDSHSIVIFLNDNDTFWYSEFEDLILSLCMLFWYVHANTL